MWKKFDDWCCRHEILIFILGGVVLLRIPTLLEPYWYGDEGIYLALGQAMAAGRELYQQIHDNKPPLLYVLAAIAGGNLFWFKFIVAAINVATVAMFWKLAHRLGSHLGALLATIAFALFTNLPLLEGNIANAELVFLFPTVAAFWLLLTHKKNIHIVIGGLLLGIASLIKMPAILEVGIWPIIWLVSDKQWFKKSFLLGIAAIAPLVISIGYYAWRGSLPSYLIAVGLQNVPYLSSWQAIPGFMGTLTGRAFIAGIGIGGLVLLRKYIGQTTFMAGIWLLVTLFAGLLSGRPYPHYFLQLVAPAALCLGAIIAERKLLAKSVSLGSLILVMVAAFVFHFYHYPTIPYYRNFLTWVSQSQTRDEYYIHFNSAVNRNYAIAKTILAGSTPQDEIFVWGDEPMIYPLAKRLPCGRYTAKYHIMDFGAQEETVNCLIKSPPKYIVTFGNASELTGLPEVLKSNYLLENKVDNAEIWRRMGYN